MARLTPPPLRITVVCEWCNRLIGIEDNCSKLRNSRRFDVCDSCSELPDEDELFEEE